MNGQKTQVEMIIDSLSNQIAGLVKDNAIRLSEIELLKQENEALKAQQTETVEGEVVA